MFKADALGEVAQNDVHAAHRRAAGERVRGQPAIPQASGDHNL
jgi:hypothetical protein